jgi:hypothetical protein
MKAAMAETAIEVKEVELSKDEENEEDHEIKTELRQHKAEAVGPPRQLSSRRYSAPA